MMVYWLIFILSYPNDFILQIQISEIKSQCSNMFGKDYDAADGLMPHLFQKDGACGKKDMLVHCHIMHVFSVTS